METLTCPKCQGSMRTYERSSITVDQCTECRGIFLDRGELERLVDAEVAFNAPAPADRRYEEKRYDERKYDKYGNQQYPRKKKKSFFEELFD